MTVGDNHLEVIMSCYYFVEFAALALAVSACGSNTVPAVEINETKSATQEASPLQENTQQVPETTPTPTSVPASRENPAPAGLAVIVGEITLTVTGAARGVDSTIAAASTRNPIPEPGNEFIMVSVTATCNSGSQSKCAVAMVFVGEFTLVGSSSIVREPEKFIAGVPDLLETQAFGNAPISGSLVFQVRRGETDLTLLYANPFGDEAFMALP